MPHKPIFPNADGYRWVCMSTQFVAANASCTAPGIWSADSLCALLVFSPDFVFSKDAASTVCPAAKWKS